MRKTSVAVFCMAAAMFVMTQTLSGRRIATKVDTKAMQAPGTAGRQDTPAGPVLVLTGDSAAMSVRLYGYDKPYSSARESVFLSSGMTSGTVDSVLVKVEYMTMRGEGLHSRVLTLPCNTLPGRSERIHFPTWDTTHTFYYYRTPPGRKQGLTPYTVLITPLAVYVR